MSSLSFKNRKVVFVFLFAAAVLLTRASAQPAATGAVDVSKYPNPALLPGKGPTNVWRGLATRWAERHQEWAGHETADHGAVVFLGDSITQGWNSLARDFPEYHVANRGIGGDTTRGVLYRMQQDVLDLDPDAVVLLIGTNDIGIGADPDDVADNIKEILGRIKAHNPHTPVVVCSVMPSSATQSRPADKIKRLNAAIAERIKGDPEFTSCDTWTLFADANGDAPREIFKDLLHPNAAGYEKWTATLRPILASLNLKHVASN